MVVLGTDASRALPERLLDTLTAMTIEMERYKRARFGRATTSCREPFDRTAALELLSDLRAARRQVRDR